MFAVCFPMEDALASGEADRCYRSLTQVDDTDMVGFLGFRWTGSDMQQVELR